MAETRGCRHGNLCKMMQIAQGGPVKIDGAGSALTQRHVGKIGGDILTACGKGREVVGIGPLAPGPHSGAVSP